MGLLVPANGDGFGKAEKCKGPLIKEAGIRFPQACGFPAAEKPFPSFLPLPLSGGCFDFSRHPCLEIRRIPWRNKGFAGAPDLLIRIEFRAEVVPAFQGALLIDRAPAFFIQKRTRMHSSSFVNLQVYGLSGVRKSSATLIDLVFKRAIFTGIHRMFPPVRLLASPHMSSSTGPSHL